MGYREIDVSAFDAVEPASQPAPQIAWVNVSELVIDEDYQRPLRETNLRAIRKIAQDFRWSRFSPIIVAPVTGGRFAVIDGQHRVHAAAVCGFETVPAMIALVQPEEQAAAFIEINTRQIRVSGHHVYKAALKAGESWAVQCRDVVEAAGCVLMDRNNVTRANKKPGQVYAINLIRNLVSAGHGAGVTLGLSAMLAYQPDSVANFDGALLGPWLNAVVSDARFQKVDLVAVLASHRPWLVIEKAGKMAKENGLQIAPAKRDAFIYLLKQGNAVASVTPSKPAPARQQLVPLLGRARDMLEYLSSLRSGDGFDAELDLEICEGLFEKQDRNILATDIGVDGKAMDKRFALLTAKIRDRSGALVVADKPALLEALQRRVVVARQIGVL